MKGQSRIYCRTQTPLERMKNVEAHWGRERRSCQFVKRGNFSVIEQGILGVPSGIKCKALHLVREVMGKG